MKRMKTGRSQGISVSKIVCSELFHLVLAAAAAERSGSHIFISLRCGGSLPQNLKISEGGNFYFGEKFLGENFLGKTAAEQQRYFTY